MQNVNLKLLGSDSNWYYKEVQGHPVKDAPEFAITRAHSAGNKSPGCWNITHRRTGLALNLYELPSLTIARKLVLALTRETGVEWENIRTDDDVKALDPELSRRAKDVLRRPEYDPSEE